MGSIYKRKGSPYYWIKYTCPGRGLIRESSSSKVAREAKALLAKRESAAFEGKYFPLKGKGEIRLKALAELWLMGQSVLRSYADSKSRVSVILRYFDSGIPLARTIGLEQLHSFIEYLTVKRKVRPATINRYLFTLKGMFRLGYENHYLESNPTKALRYRDEENERTRVCTPREYGLLLAHSSGDMRLAIIIAYHTGMRLSEIAKMQLSRINLSKAIASVTGGQFELPPSVNKSKRHRSVPFPLPVLEAMRDHASLASTEQDKLMLSKPNWLSKEFKRVCWRAKIEGLIFHDLRRTYITHAAGEAGVSPLVVAKTVGHRDLNVLFRNYYQVTESETHKAVAAMQKVLLPHSSRF